MKLTIYGVMLGMLVLSGCSQDDSTTASAGTTKYVTLTVDDVALDKSARTVMTLGTTGLSIAWADDDLVGVFGAFGQQVRLTFTDGDNGTSQSATFASEDYQLKSENKYVAYYPMVNDVTATPKISVSYTGQTQSGNGSLAHLSAYDYIVSDQEIPSETNTVAFELHHQAAFVWLKITMPEAGTWTNVKISTADGSAAFTTAATLDLFGETLFNATATSDNMTLALDGVSTTASDDLLSAWMVVAPADLSATTLNVTVTSENGTRYTGTAIGKNFLAGRAYILTFTTSAVVTSDVSVGGWTEDGNIGDGKATAQE